MIPRTFPSIIEAFQTKMVVYVLPSITGLTAWIDYIPVKGVVTESATLANTYANGGYQVVKSLDSLTGLQAWIGYIPVYEDASYNKPWSTDAGGYVPVGGLFSIPSLFASGAPGVWYDPSDYTTLFQDSAGTTPVTAVEQPVGLMLDKSQGLVLGNEILTNGTFESSIAGWTAGAGSAAWVAGTAQITGSAGVIARLYQGMTLTAGKWYLMTATCVSTTDASATLEFLGGSVSTTFTSGQTKNLYFTPASTGTFYAQVRNTNAGAVVSAFDNISVKELPGNHAFQATSASRPVLSARYNLLTKTEQFNDAVWSKVTDTITANQAVAPDGTMTADLWTHTSGRIQVNATLANTTTSLYIKPISGGSTITINTAGNVAADEVVFNLSTLTVTTLGANNTAATITAVNDGWLRLTVTRGATAGSTLYFGLGSPASNNYIWGASLVPANQSTLPYQRVNTATDYNTTGFLPYLKFDGVDDSLSTNSISFTATDKMSVFSGVRKLSDAAVAIVAEIGGGGAIGSFAFAAPFTVASNYGSLLTGNVSGSPSTVSLTATTFAAPLTNVVTLLLDISQPTRATESLMRVNGATPTLAYSGAASAGTGNFGNHPLYIGRRGGSSLPLNGQMYSMIIVGKAVTAGELSSTETYVNQKTGAY